MDTDALTREARHNLIASDRVEGTAVRRPNGDKVGNIERLMVDKVSGQVAYAVLSFGGFFGLGNRHFPIPWGRLHYNVAHQCYELDLSDEELKKAPSFDASGDFDWGDRSDEIHLYYGSRTYWDY